MRSADNRLELRVSDGDVEKLAHGAVRELLLNDGARMRFCHVDLRLLEAGLRMLASSTILLTWCVVSSCLCLGAAS